MTETTTREKWAERVARWKASGQTATQFQAKTGIRAGSLRYWQWRLRKERQPQRARAFIEVAPATILPAAAPESLEVVLSRGLRLRVPPRFDADAVRQLVDALEAR